MYCYFIYLWCIQKAKIKVINKSISKFRVVTAVTTLPNDNGKKKFLDIQQFHLNCFFLGLTWFILTISRIKLPNIAILPFLTFYLPYHFPLNCCKSFRQLLMTFKYPVCSARRNCWIMVRQSKLCISTSKSCISTYILFHRIYMKSDFHF